MPNFVLYVNTTSCFVNTVSINVLYDISSLTCSLMNFLVKLNTKKSSTCTINKTKKSPFMETSHYMYSVIKTGLANI